MPNTAQPFAQGFCYPEGPRWHDGLLWFSDQHDGHVRALDSKGKTVVEFSVPGRPSGLGWLPGGDLLIVSMERRCLFRRHNGKLIDYADLRAVHPADSNDMVVDREGRAWVGNIGFDFYGGEAMRNTAIAKVDGDARVTLAADDLCCPNGTVIAADGQTLIIAESLAHRLTAFTLNPEGQLVDRRLWADLGEDVPDGICLDSEGCVWAAVPFSQAVIRVAEGGEILERVSIEGANPYACVLGGEDGKTLYICCAPDHDPEITRARRGGRIDVARVDVSSAGSP